MVAGNRFVVRNTAQPKSRHIAEPPRILIDAGTRAVWWRRIVVSGGIGFTERGKWLRNNRRLRPFIEEKFGSFFRIADDRVNIEHDLGTALPRLRIWILQVEPQ